MMFCKMLINSKCQFLSHIVSGNVGRAKVGHRTAGGRAEPACGNGGRRGAGGVREAMAGDHRRLQP